MEKTKNTTVPGPQNLMLENREKLLIQGVEQEGRQGGELFRGCERGEGRRPAAAIPRRKAMLSAVWAFCPAGRRPPGSLCPLPAR